MKLLSEQLVLFVKMLAQEKTDEVLVAETLQGKLTSYDVLVRRYHKRIYYFTLKYLRDESAADDAAQEAFIRAFENLHQLKPGLPFKTWFYQIAKNYCFDYLRKRSRFVPMSEDYETDEQSVIEKIINKDETSKLYRALGKLPTIYRQVIFGYYFSNLNYQSLANSLALPVNTVRTRLRRGKSFLSKLMRAP